MAGKDHEITIWRKGRVYEVLFVHCVVQQGVDLFHGCSLHDGMFPLDSILASRSIHRDMEKVTNSFEGLNLKGRHILYHSCNLNGCLRQFILRIMVCA